MSRFHWVVLRHPTSGPCVISRHRDFDAASRKYAALAKEHDGITINPIALNRLGTPVFEPEIGEVVSLDGQSVRQKSHTKPNNYRRNLSDEPVR